MGHGDSYLCDVGGLLRIFLLTLIVVTSGALHAQSYGVATGLRLGNGTDGRTMGLTAQYRVSRHTTIESILQTDFATEHMLHLIVQEHQPFLTRRVNIYIGAGLSIGQEQSIILSDDGLTQRVSNGPTAGVDLIAGVEATLAGYTISLDVRPNFNMAGREQWVENEIGVSLRKVVLSGAAINKKRRQRRKAKKKKEREKERAKRDPWLSDWFKETFGKD